MGMVQVKRGGRQSAPEVQASLAGILIATRYRPFPQQSNQCPEAVSMYTLVSSGASHVSLVGCAQTSKRRPHGPLIPKGLSGYGQCSVPNIISQWQELSSTCQCSIGAGPSSASLCRSSSRWSEFSLVQQSTRCCADKRRVGG